MIKRSAQASLGFGLTALFIILAINRVDWAAVGHSLETADYRFVWPAAAATLTGYALRSLRWQQLLRPIKAIPWRPVAAALMLGFAANNVLPARVGELVRAHEIGRQQQVSRAAAFTTILLERVFDGLTLVLVLGLVLLFSPAARENPRLQVTGYLAALVFLGTLTVIGLALWREGWLLTVLDWLARPLPRRLQVGLPRVLDRLLEGLRVLRSRHLVGRIVGLSTLVWLCEGLSYFLILHAFNLSPEGGNFILAAALLMASVNLGIMVPSAPGYIGTFQLFAILALGVFGISTAPGLSVALVAHAMQYFLVTSIGVAIFLRGQSRRVWPAEAVVRRHSG